jgi:hypothetical protein
MANYFVPTFALGWPTNPIIANISSQSRDQSEGRCALSPNPTAHATALKGRQRPTRQFGDHDSDSAHRGVPPVRAPQQQRVARQSKSMANEGANFHRADGAPSSWWSAACRGYVPARCPPKYLLQTESRLTIGFGTKVTPWEGRATAVASALRKVRTPKQQRNANERA